MASSNNQVSGRWEGWQRALNWKSARSLYNVADAYWPEHALEAAERVERALRGRGPQAARWMWLALVWLDWEPLFRGEGGRFWRLDRARRRAAVERWSRSHIGFRARAFRQVRNALLETN